MQGLPQPGRRRKLLWAAPAPPAQTPQPTAARPLPARPDRGRAGGRAGGGSSSTTPSVLPAPPAAALCRPAARQKAPAGYGAPHACGTRPSPARRPRGPRRKRWPGAPDPLRRTINACAPRPRLAPPGGARGGRRAGPNRTAAARGPRRPRSGVRAAAAAAAAAAGPAAARPWGLSGRCQTTSHKVANHPRQMPGAPPKLNGPAAAWRARASPPASARLSAHEAARPLRGAQRRPEGPGPLAGAAPAARRPLGRGRRAGGPRARVGCIAPPPRPPRPWPQSGRRGGRAGAASCCPRAPARQAGAPASAGARGPARAAAAPAAALGAGRPAGLKGPAHITVLDPLSPARCAQPRRGGTSHLIAGRRQAASTIHPPAPTPQPAALASRAARRGRPADPNTAHALPHPGPPRRPAPVPALRTCARASRLAPPAAAGAPPPIFAAAASSLHRACLCLDSLSPCLPASLPRSSEYYRASKPHVPRRGPPGARPRPRMRGPRRRSRALTAACKQ
jgi:hypothetical protein